MATAIILAAGLGSRLSPHTDNLPKPFVPVCGTPMIVRCLNALRENGVSKFIVVRGYMRDEWDAKASLLGPDVTFIDNADFQNNNMLQSLVCAIDHIAGEVFVSYSDIVYSSTVVQELVNCKHDINLVIDKDFEKIYVNRKLHPFEQCEATICSAGTVTSIGKGCVSRISECSGEFIGLCKFSASGSQVVSNALKVLKERFSGHEVEIFESGRSWQKAYLCDFFSHLIKGGNLVSECPVYGMWREVDTPEDLENADLSMKWLDDPDHAVHVTRLGQRMLSEANDLKRTTRALASDIGIDHHLLEAIVSGKAEEERCRDVLMQMTKVYPVSVTDLWIEKDASIGGVIHMSAATSRESCRIFNRKMGNGQQAPYYEYRDTAMSAAAPFKPEWIKELRLVSDSDPQNPDVQFNNGHLLHQYTFFIGPVNFYYEVGGEKRVSEMNTGDTNFITPFVKHSFASRSGKEDAIIIAVTFGCEAKYALNDLLLAEEGALNGYVGDMRNPSSVLCATLKRKRLAEAMDVDVMVDLLVSGGFDRRRARDIVEVGNAKREEVVRLASILGFKESDLMFEMLRADDEVVVSHFTGAKTYLFPSS
eukprot:CAMPEP_0182854376 /NCGR_PEP_ID=MMETSP0034_2-20130328/1206_1 /TAXON_ID=156128 /ORGANISM="Nephroselmis pyriformis, Strain CCMP717" /LENGTH=591 /DNA_ID=CAMNT_0024985197 /DNA_START=1758 /DNA_END=3530 /DNA_ORIENTATION=+